ncbi:MAG: ABC transporter permease [Clostridia bacterium]|nr:ABC transporter permease [Clostridia bacterium]MBQ2110603.1 ABC transporter permease [Clostridia bacterium]
MNIMNRVTWQTMKKNRVRTVVTIIGIILSTAMFTAVLTICTSLYNYLLEGETYQSGTYHAHAYAVTADAVRKTAEDPRTEYAAALENVGYAVIGSQNDYKPYLFVAAADECFLREMPVHLTSGRLPESDSELILPEHLRANGGVSRELGSVLELELGTRSPVSGESLDLYQNCGYIGQEEQFTARETKAYTVVGFYERPDFEPYSAPGYTALSKAPAEMDPDASYECYLRVAKPGENLESFLADHPELNENGTELHDSLLAFEGYYRYDNFGDLLTKFAIILCVLIFAGSVSLIYSAFSISVSERTKQFGLLSSVGATRKQQRSSVLTEALTLSAIGIPLGVLAGVGGIAVTLFFLRDMFSSLAGAWGGTLRVHVTVLGIAAAAAIAFVTVLVSAWIPANRAMRISPIEAIRQSRDVKVKASASARPGLAARLFGAEGLLAKKYYARSRKKYRATVISLVMSIILFVAASGFCLYITRSINSVDNRPGFDVAYANLDRDVFEKLRGDIAEQTTALAAYANEAEGDDHTRYAYITAEDSTPEYRKYLAATASDSVYVSPIIRLLYMDDVSFRELLKENGLSEEDYFGRNGKALVFNHGSVPVYGESTRENYVFDFLKSGTGSILVSKPLAQAPGYRQFVCWSGDRYGEGDLLVYSEPQNGECEYDDHDRPVGQPTSRLDFEEISIGALIEKEPVGALYQDVLELVYPLSSYEKAETVSLYFNSANPENSIKRIVEIMKADGLTVSENDFYDLTENNRLMNNLVTIIKVFSYGFIALISLISVANVFNTVTTNVALRRRDYAMLRSMGMTKKGMNRMTNYECLIYGSRSLLIGLPIAIGVTYLIHLAANDAAHMRFTLPWAAVAIAVLSVFTVVFVSMLYSTGKLKKDNPIDALKDENI